MPDELSDYLLPSPILGAGEVISALWKEPDETVGWQMRFRIFRLTHSGGDVTRDFRPQDLVHLVRLCRLLAVTFVQEGWISAEERQELGELAANLDAIIDKEL